MDVLQPTLSKPGEVHSYSKPSSSKRSRLAKRDPSDGLSTEDARRWRENIFERLAEGQVGILPTDTLYGLTCSAWDEAAVDRIGRIKGRQTPATILPHTIEWALNFVHSDHREAVRQALCRRPSQTVLTPCLHQPADLSAGSPLGLPQNEQEQERGDAGKAKAKAKAPAFSLMTSGLIGLRCPDHWLTGLALLGDEALPPSLRLPIISTSANLTGAPPETDPDRLTACFSEHIDFLVDVGPLLGPPSALLKIDGTKTLVVARK